MNIRQQLATSNRVYAGRNSCDYITIHETGNRTPGAGAAAHANLQSRGNVRNATWHYQVDDKEVVQSFPDTTRCWHAGDGRGPGNLSSIAIEICVNPDSDFAKAVSNAAELVVVLRNRHEIPLSNVVQHNHWSGKNCPSTLRIGDGWANFRELASGLAAPVSNPVTPAPAPVAGHITEDGVWGVETSKRLQQVLRTPADGVISNQLPQFRGVNKGLTTGWDWTGMPYDRGSTVIREMQRRIGAEQDGHVGPQTFGRLQRYLGTPIDGYVSHPSQMVQALQRRLNAGAF